MHLLIEHRTKLLSEYVRNVDIKCHVPLFRIILKKHLLGTQNGVKWDIAGLKIDITLH